MISCGRGRARGHAPSSYTTQKCSAAPYMLLVAVALARLRPPWLRRALIAIVLIWAALSGVNEMRRTDTHIAWDALARTLSVNDAAQARRVKVYMLDDFPRYPMSFYLHVAGDDRFEFVRADADRLAALADEHFWVVYDEGAWPRARPRPQEIMRERGYTVGVSTVSGPRGRGYALFPVWR